ncbi:DUF3540 domain-containing protein [Thiotrichales bacterium 19S3-7]|nr:DUF3540 domain-containing protein [Thiotrichales bacterium 19S3-7]MCF6802149.1 DUF3540 domain-containing protein [Thiotrichales bacterium 19S3-11]
MNHSTSSIPLHQHHQHTCDTKIAEIIDQDDQRYQVQVNQHCYYAKKAYSCMIEPEIGDIVTIEFNESTIYITNLLERSSDSSMKMNLPEDTTITSTGSINLNAPSIKQTSLNYELLSESIIVTGSIVKMLTQHLFQFSEYNQIKTKQLFKEVDEFEQSITQSLRMIIEEQIRLDAKSIHLLSQRDTTIDAETVSLG